MKIPGGWYVTPKVAAQHIGVSHMRVNQILLEGKMACISLGRNINLIPVAEVKAFVKRRESGSR